MRAINIDWDTDGDSTIELPTEIEIPQGMTDLDKIGDYLTDVTGFCHFGFEVSEERRKNDMDSKTKVTLLALIDGLAKTNQVSQYAEAEKTIDGKGIELLKDFIRKA